MAKTKVERLQEVHDRAMRRMDKIWSAQEQVRLSCNSDRRFVDIPGAQFEGDLADQFENRPKIEINKVARSIDRIFNEYRQNRITVDFRTADDSADEETADLLDAMLRADEQESGAQEAYDNAFQEGCKGGIGAFRLRAEYEDDEDDENDQMCIKIDPIYDADVSVFFDVDAKRYDKADASHAFLIYTQDRESARDQWGEDVADFNPVGVNPTGYDWASDDAVYIAEYFEIEHKKERVLVYKSEDGQFEKRYKEAELDENPELQQELEMTGYFLARTKTIKRQKVHKYILSGLRVLEDCGYIAGKYLPIIPYFGNRSYINGIERAWGHALKARDPQRLYNMQASVLAEIAALSPVERPIFTTEQVQGLDQYWGEDNINRYPFALVNPLRNADGTIAHIGPTAYTKSPSIPPAMIALVEMMNRDIDDVTGNSANAQDVISNTSGAAVSMIQQRLDMSTFGYMDNFAKTMRWMGHVWLSMRRDIEVEPRKVKTLSIEGAQGTAEIMKPAIDPDTAEEITLNDISSGRYDVVVDVGPASASKREATVRNLTQLLQTAQVVDPQTAGLLLNMALVNFDGEGMEDVRKFIRGKMVRAGVMTPTQQEQEEIAQEQANAQPDPQAQLMAAAAQEAAAKAQKAQADTAKALAETEKIKAETAETLVGIKQSQLDQIMQALAAIQAQQAPMVQQ